MPFRTRLFIILSLGILIILVIGLVIVTYSRNQTPADDTVAPKNNTQNNTGGTTTNNEAGLNGTAATTGGGQVRVFTTEEKQQNAVKQLARIFTERYNSYSSENNFQNIIEVKSLVTTELWNKISAVMNTKQNTGFSGATTQVISLNLSSYKSTMATVILGCKKTVEKDGSVSTISGNAILDLVNLGGQWLVNNYKWENNAK